MTCPAFESPMKGAGLSEAQQKCDFADRKLAFRQVAHGKLTPHFCEDAPKARPLVAKAPVQCSGTHVQPRSNLLECRLSVTEFAGKAAANCVCSRFAFWQFLKHGHNLSLENRWGEGGNYEK